MARQNSIMVINIVSIFILFWFNSVCRPGISDRQWKRDKNIFHGLHPFYYLVFGVEIIEDQPNQFVMITRMMNKLSLSYHHLFPSLIGRMYIFNCIRRICSPWQFGFNLNVSLLLSSFSVSFYYSYKLGLVSDWVKFILYTFYRSLLNNIEGSVPFISAYCPHYIPFYFYTSSVFRFGKI